MNELSPYLSAFGDAKCASLQVNSPKVRLAGLGQPMHAVRKFPCPPSASYSDRLPKAGIGSAIPANPFSQSLLAVMSSFLMRGFKGLSRESNRRFQLFLLVRCPSWWVPCATVQADVRAFQGLALCVDMAKVSRQGHFPDWSNICHLQYMWLAPFNFGFVAMPRAHFETA